MIDNIINELKDKKVIILGFGREGQATYKLMRKYLKNQLIYIGDLNESIKDNTLLKGDKNIEFILGDNYLDNLEEYDVIMKSPGIAFNKIDTDKIKDKINSELELFVKYCPVPIIGITGTKGKSTTSSLIYQVLRDCNKRVLFGGNIGIAAFNLIDDVENCDYIVLEMGCHQLEFMNVSPKYSILLNIFEEHLDHYRNYDNYIEAKCNIFNHQKKNDYLLYNLDNDHVVSKVIKYNECGHVIPISYSNKDAYSYIDEDYVYVNGKRVYDINSKRNLIGKHNLNNIIFVLSLAYILKLNMNKVCDSICNFKALEHRMEYVGKYKNVDYYNDSICTIPEACINALESIHVNTLIIGGLDRGIDYSKLIDYLNKYKFDNLICIPDTGWKIADKIKNNNVKVFKVYDLKEAVRVAKENTKEGVVLLSPAAASYNAFKNFEERGSKFKEYVRND